VPRAAAGRKNAQPPNTSLCPNCGQAIPNDEIANHMRIEMLDPQWRDQNRVAMQRSSTTNLSTADVANNLKRLASQRSDVFDPVTGRAIADGGAPPSKRAEVEGEGESRPGNVEEQIRQLHQKYKG
jgi:splicing factor 3A subunit 1